MTKFQKFLIGFGIAFSFFSSSLIAYSANSIQYAPDLYPITDSKYYLGTTTKAWLNVITKQICLNGSCKTSWPTGGGSASTTITVLGVDNEGPFIFATGTPSTGLSLSLTSNGSGTITWNPQVSSGYSIPLTASTTEWSTALLTKLSTTTAAATYEPIQTKGNLTESVTGLEFNATRQVIGGAAALALTTGYGIPLTASTTEWSGFYNTPSSRITAGTQLSWSGNTLNSSAGDMLASTYDPANGAKQVAFLGDSVSLYNGNTVNFYSDTGTTLKGNIGTTAILGEYSFVNYLSGAANGILNFNTITTSAKTFTFPDNSGTIALTSDLGSFITLGSLSGTAPINYNNGTGEISLTGIVPITNGGTATSTAPTASAVLLGNGTDYDYSVIPSCSNTTTSKLLYNNSTRTFSCGTDQSGSGGGATTTITSDVQIDGPNFIFATGTATGIGLNVSGSGSTITFTPTVSANYSIPLTASTTEWATALLTKLSTTTAASTYEPILTKGNLTATAPLQFDNTRQVIGGAAALSLAAGYNIPLTASTTNWNTAYGWGNHAGLYPTFSYASSSYATLWNLQAGSNITINTSTPGVISISSTGSGSGNSAWTIGSNKIYNATSTDFVGIGTTSPIATLSVMGTSSAPTVNPFVVASSSGAQLLTVLPNGNVGVGTAAPTNKLQIVDSSVAIGQYSKIFSAYSTGMVAGDTSQLSWGMSNSLLNQAEFNFYYAGSSSSFNRVGLGLNGLPRILNLTGTGNVGVGTTTPIARLSVQGAADANALFDLSSSTGTSLFRVLANGNVGIGSSSPSAAFVVDSGTAVGTASSTIMVQQKFQIDTYNSAGTRVCLTIVGTTPTVTTGACP